MIGTGKTLNDDDDDANDADDADGDSVDDGGMGCGTLRTNSI